jgi:streptogramin lyase
MHRGFTLIQISILLLVASLVLVTILPSTRTALNAGSTTTSKMNNVFTALRSYLAANGTLPCPADGSLPIGSSNYGTAASKFGPGVSNNCGHGGAINANYVDDTNTIAIGMLPVRTLSLPNDSALDAFGRTVTYAVDTNATACGWASASLPGKITVTDNGMANSTVLALVSHGMDGHGAWVPLTGSSGSAVRLNAGSTDTDQLTNAHVDNSFTPTATLANFVSKTPTGTFDDIVVYKSPLWNTNTLPASAPQISSITPPANGTYSSGQVLSFTVTFNTAVTVNTGGGTPYLSLSAITGSIGTGNLAKATYQSGSGTTSLIFSYTVAGTDTAPTGLTMPSASIALNGGTIMDGNSCVMLAFGVPDLSKVIIGGGTVYLTNWVGGWTMMFDTNGHYVAPDINYGFEGGIGVDPTSHNIWLVQGSGAGAYIAKLDSSGNLLNQYTNPGSITNWFPQGVAVDQSGNVFTVDYTNNKVDEFNGNTLALIQTFGSTGTRANSILDNLSSPSGIGVDASGNVWVADVNNNRIVKFQISGATATTVQQIPTGCDTCGQNNAPGTFHGPSDVKIDSAGNIWVADDGNNRVQELNPAGTSALQNFTACTTGGSAFSGVKSIALDSTGNRLWVADYNNNQIVQCSVSGSTNAWVRNITSASSGSSAFNGPWFVNFNSAR